MRRPVIPSRRLRVATAGAHGCRTGVDRHPDWNRQGRTGRSPSGCRRPSELTGADWRTEDADHERERTAALPGSTSWAVRTGHRGPGIFGVSRRRHPHWRRRHHRENSGAQCRGHRGITGRRGSRLAIEARGSGFETRFGPEDLKTIPVRRFSMFDFIRAAPGVSPTSPGRSPRIACRRSDRARTRTRSLSTARTSPAHAAARRDPSQASTSFRKCRSKAWERRRSSATCRARSSTSSPGRAATVFCMTRRITDRPPP